MAARLRLRSPAWRLGPFTKSTGNPLPAVIVAMSWLPMMNRAWPDQIAFLPFDAAVFTDGGVPMNFQPEIYVTTPKTYYDATIVSPIVHGIRLGRARR